MESPTYFGLFGQIVRLDDELRVLRTHLGKKRGIRTQRALVDSLKRIQDFIDTAIRHETQTLELLCQGESPMSPPGSTSKPDHSNT